MKTGIVGVVAAASVLGFASMAAAQEESTNRVAVETDWSAFMEEEPKACWAVSSPKETVNTRDGNVVSVRRGDIMIFVSYRPEQGIAGEVSFTGGYPFAEDSTVSVEVGDDTFQLFTSGEWAWAASPEDDARILEAFKRGAEAVVTGRSARGTNTQDTFSLFGFTAIVEAVEANCS
ncbi:invasion associated locus B family protein [Alkalilacustris brevis]|uniref:invasion associated locus B family protein n=1 Tax=Alkalilacustris brevis TaxID=2026338 RepID=UPI000E0DE340|nr:invasion associated locus B family protein [Alkalilacustris brevis]